MLLPRVEILGRIAGMHKDDYLATRELIASLHLR